MVMTIYHAGGTADTGELINGAYESTDYGNAGQNRGCIYVDSSRGYRIRCLDPSTGQPTSVTKAWFHWAWGTGYSYQDQAVWQFANADGVQILRAMTQSGSRRDWHLGMQYFNGSTWVTIPGLQYQNPGDGGKTMDTLIDMEAGRIEIYQNGVLMTATDISAIVGMNIASVYLTNGSYDRYAYFQTLIASGESTIGCNVRTRYAVAAGTDTAWTGTFADVDEYPYNDGDYITAANAGDKESFIANNLPALPVGNEVKGVVIAARFRNNGGTPGNIRPYLFIGEIRYPAANFPNASMGWTAGVTVFSKNPATNDAWGKDINTVNVQFGIEATE